MNWTDERVEALRKLWAEGLSASQIAAQLGGVTRNAVIGKVHRLKLSGRGRATASPARQKKTAQATSIKPQQRTTAPAPRPVSHSIGSNDEVAPVVLKGVPTHSTEGVNTTDASHSSFAGATGQAVAVMVSV